ncbi:MAG: hypothetical protein J2P15_09465 [Micromonosporaceae bacterium]|nr:hypothetical protein [Micromonosporaceae bacterium]
MHCPVCGSQRLTPLAEMRTAGQHPRVLLKFGSPGLFKFAPRADLYARVCLDCGAVTPFISAPDRQRLAATDLLDATSIAQGTE